MHSHIPPSFAFVRRHWIEEYQLTTSRTRDIEKIGIHRMSKVAASWREANWKKTKWIALSVHDRTYRTGRWNVYLEYGMQKYLANESLYKIYFYICNEQNFKGILHMRNIRSHGLCVDTAFWDGWYVDDVVMMMHSQPRRNKAPPSYSLYTAYKSYANDAPKRKMELEAYDDKYSPPPFLFFIVYLWPMSCLPAQVRQCWGLANV